MCKESVPQKDDAIVKVYWFIHKSHLFRDRYEADYEKSTVTYEILAVWDLVNDGISDFIEVEGSVHLNVVRENFKNVLAGIEA